MSYKDLRRFVYGKLGFDEHDDTFFPDHYRELCAGKKELEKEIGDMCAEKIRTGDFKWFEAVAKTLKLWPPDIAKTQQFIGMPVWAAAWRFFNKGKGAERCKYRRWKTENPSPLGPRMIEYKELKRGEFTRGDLSNWIYRETSIRPSPSQLTELLDSFKRRAKKKHPPGRPSQRKQQKEIMREF
jgi:hypothetical protein